MKSYDVGRLLTISPPSRLWETNTLFLQYLECTFYVVLKKQAFILQSRWEEGVLKKCNISSTYVYLI